MAASSSAAEASGSGASEPTDESLKLAEQNFNDGIQAIKDNNLSKAVDLLAKSLDTRVAKHGELSLECASTYYEYGAALLYKARDDADVFGAPLQQAADEHGQDPLGLGDFSAEKDDTAGEEKENVDVKGKGIMREEAGDAVDGVDDKEGSEDGEGEEEEAEDDGDLQLAWENLEAAKFVYAQHKDQFRTRLGDVHMLLGDVAQETEAFERALTDYQEALQLFLGATPPDPRAIIAAHYNISITHHFLSNIPEALTHAETAFQLCTSRIEEVKRVAAEALAELGAGGEDLGGASADAGTAGASGPTPSAQEKAATEVSDLEAILVGIQDKVDDLRALKKELDAARGMLKIQLKTPNADSNPASANAAEDEKSFKTALEPAQPTFGSAPSFGSAPTSSTAGAAVSGGAGVRQPQMEVMGVVGRGSKRISLMPTGAGSSVPSTAQAAGPGAAGGAAAKRMRLEPIMTASGCGGSDAGSAGISFGSAPAEAVKGPSRSSPLVELPGSGLGNQEPAAPRPLPSFLQPSSVAAVYGASTAVQPVNNDQQKKS